MEKNPDSIKFLQKAYSLTKSGSIVFAKYKMPLVSSENKTKIREITKYRTETKFRQVEETKEEIRYHAVEKTRQENKTTSLWNYFFN